MTDPLQQISGAHLLVLLYLSIGANLFFTIWVYLEQKRGVGATRKDLSDFELEVHKAFGDRKEAMRAALNDLSERMRRRHDEFAQNLKPHELKGQVDSLARRVDEELRSIFERLGSLGTAIDKNHEQLSRDLKAFDDKVTQWHYDEGRFDERISGRVAALEEKARA